MHSILEWKPTRCIFPAPPRTYKYGWSQDYIGSWFRSTIIITWRHNLPSWHSD